MRFGSVAGGAPFGRQPLKLNRTAEREAESAADQAPLQLIGKPYQDKYVENLIAKYLVKEIVHGVLLRFVHRIARVDGPSPLQSWWVVAQS
jgi:hypothetical protein